MAQQIIMLEPKCEMNKNDDDNDRICLDQISMGVCNLGRFIMRTLGAEYFRLKFKI